jgi:hypothetical protein
VVFLHRNLTSFHPPLFPSTEGERTNQDHLHQSKQALPKLSALSNICANLGNGLTASTAFLISPDSLHVILAYHYLIGESPMAGKDTVPGAWFARGEIYIWDLETHI